MKKNHIVIVSILGVLLALNIVIKPILRRNDAVHTVQSVLTHWQDGSLTLAMPYWENEVDSPPIYGLTAYKIGKGKIDKKDGIYYARISADLEFSPGNQLSSGKNWIFKLKKTRYGWKVTNFQLADK